MRAEAEPETEAVAVAEPGTTVAEAVVVGFAVLELPALNTAPAVSAASALRGRGSATAVSTPVGVVVGSPVR
jgi:hypothetical protein